MSSFALVAIPLMLQEVISSIMYFSTGRAICWSKFMDRTPMSRQISCGFDALVTCIACEARNDRRISLGT